MYFKFFFECQILLQDTQVKTVSTENFSKTVYASIVFVELLDINSWVILVLIQIHLLQYT